VPAMPCGGGRCGEEGSPCRPRLGSARDRVRAGSACRAGGDPPANAASSSAEAAAHGVPHEAVGTGQGRAAGERMRWRWPAGRAQLAEVAATAERRACATDPIVFSESSRARAAGQSSSRSRVESSCGGRGDRADVQHIAVRCTVTAGWSLPSGVCGACARHAATRARLQRRHTADSAARPGPRRPRGRAQQDGQWSPRSGWPRARTVSRVASVTTTSASRARCGRRR
jgi:hypothetical protein